MTIEVIEVQPGSITIRLNSTTDQDCIGFDSIHEYLPPMGEFEYATFYSERGQSIIGVTDDEECRTHTRDGEYPVATINIYRRK
jgi:hypothetical protein